MKEKLENYFKENRERFLAELKSFLKFESISTDPAYEKQCRACAEWIVDHLRSMGLSDACLLETSGKPVVFASNGAEATDATRVIFYGHYDVQPVDPLELWESPPFEAEERDGRLYARGAVDNKGQLFYFLKALEYLINNDLLNCSVKIFLEGEEECGSPAFSALLDQWRARLAGDVLLVCDTGTHLPEVATITMGLKGIVSLTATLRGAHCDLHSGLHGGIAPNPAQGMVRMLSSLHNADGGIAIDGFYDSVVPLSSGDRELALSHPLTEEYYTASTGVAPCGGEKGLSIAERGGLRPTVEINGIGGGYTGDGFKTIVPAQTVAKISCRLVSGQDPAQSLKLLVQHLEKNTPEGLTLEISGEEEGGPALSLSSESGAIERAAEVLEDIVDEPIAYLWLGGSIPLVAGLVEVSGAEPVLVGFGLPQDNVHAPNESFMLEQFRKGFIFCALYLNSFT